MASSAILSLGFWVAGKGVLTTIWDFTSAWLMDLTTICGGNATEPVDITGIAAAASLGKERNSVIKQGSGQAISYQALQFGNGGTSPIYLNLDSTAIEFPGQYNAAAKRVTYNSIDNVIGLNYYAGSGDVIKHINSVVSSPSDYHWRINVNSSALATYDFSGLAVIGAGDVVLRNVTTFTGMSFVNCTIITQNSAPMVSCTFNNSFILSNLPSAISNSVFVGDNNGHALEITSPGTYSFSGNTFSGFGVNGTTSAAIYNNSGGSVIINITGGSTPTIRNGVGASTTVNNNIILTLTGLVTGSDIVILQAGTSNVLVTVDSNVGTIYAYSYSTQQIVDIGIIKQGFVPLYIRNYSLAAASTSLPISQSADRNFI